MNLNPIAIFFEPTISRYSLIYLVIFSISFASCKKKIESEKEPFIVTNSDYILTKIIKEDYGLMITAEGIDPDFNGTYQDKSSSPFKIEFNLDVENPGANETMVFSDSSLCITHDDSSCDFNDLNFRLENEVLAISETSFTVLGGSRFEKISYHVTRVKPDAIDSLENDRISFKKRYFSRVVDKKIYMPKLVMLYLDANNSVNILNLTTEFNDEFSYPLLDNEIIFVQQQWKVFELEQ